MSLHARRCLDAEAEAVGRLEKLAMIERRPIAVGASIDATIRAPSSGIEPASTAPLK